MSLSGNPATTWFQLLPESALWKAPSRVAMKIWPSGDTVTPRTLIGYEARRADSQAAPASWETRTAERVAATTRPSLACTATKSFSPATGPPTQTLPRSLLVKSPEEVAANQRVCPRSVSLTRPSRTARVLVVELTVFFLPLFSVTVLETVFATTTSLMGCQVELPSASSKTPLLVPATRVPLLACLRVNTSRPSRPELFCSQFCPPS